MADDQEFLATWSSHSQWSQVHDDGRETVDFNIELPPLRVLSKHAQRLVGGALLIRRVGGLDKDWDGQPLWRALWEDRGLLELKAKLGQTGHLEWSIVFRIAGGEPGANGFSGTYMSPSMALAWMIAVVEEHEHEVRSGMIEHTGGHA